MRPDLIIRLNVPDLHRNILDALPNWIPALLTQLGLSIMEELRSSPVRHCR